MIFFLIITGVLLCISIRLKLRVLNQRKFYVGAIKEIQEENTRLRERAKKVERIIRNASGKFTLISHE